MDDNGTPSNIQMGAVSELIDNLKYTNEESGFFCKVKCENGKAWFKLLTDVSKTFPAVTFSSLKDLYNSLLEKRGFDFNSSLSLTLYLAQQYGLIAEGTGIWNNLTSLVDKNYDLNISRFRIFVKSLLVAAPQLTTYDRMQWWKSNLIPTNIHYYAIAGTLIDPEINPDVAESQIGSGPFFGQDYKSLLANYRDFANINHAKLNDSQMSVQKVRFWPELNMILNPAQEKYPATFLGVLGAHHWALALSVVNANKDGSKNPFPRTQLIESLAAAVAYDLQN
jgi:hypothetical protein